MRQSLMRHVVHRDMANVCPEAVECVPSFSCIREEKQWFQWFNLTSLQSSSACPAHLWEKDFSKEQQDLLIELSLSFLIHKPAGDLIRKSVPWNGPSFAPVSKLFK